MVDGIARTGRICNNPDEYQNRHERPENFLQQARSLLVPAAASRASLPFLPENRACDRADHSDTLGKAFENVQVSGDSGELIPLSWLA
jgi:hypothetical protein